LQQVSLQVQILNSLPRLCDAAVLRLTRSCFWLSLVAGACDSLTMVLNGFLLVVLTKSLGLLATFQAIAFGCSTAAVLWNCQVLCSRAAELRLNKAVLLLAGLPFYQAAKAGVLLAPLPTGEERWCCLCMSCLPMLPAQVPRAVQLTLVSSMTAHICFVVFPLPS
jgi:hypothetical protein